ncbi:MAG: ABC transporter permease [Anaerolineales bacterium]|jgi:hypothetical protein|nr:ABC transporter permease [Anaerolineales bacterium]
MSHFWVYALLILAGLLTAGMVVVAVRYSQAIRAARKRLNSLGSQVVQTACGPVEYTRITRYASPMLNAAGINKPVSRSTLLAGKILARFTLGLLQFLVVFKVGALFKMNFGKDPLALFLLVIVTSLAITTLAFAVGSGLKNPAQASMLGLLLSLTLAPVGGAWWPMNISPKFLQIIGHVSPVARAMDGFTAITHRGATLVDILVPMAVLAGMTIVLFLIAIPRFKYQVD